MPTYTKYYKLSMRAPGEQYSGSGDRSRMSIIDNQIAFLADIIGDGRISGWQTINTDGLNIKVNEGMGIIDRFVTRTFGDLKTTLEPNAISYVYMQRKPNILGTYSNRSNASSIFYADNTPPSSPSGFNAQKTTNDSISLVWDDNTEVDFGLYKLYRSGNGVTWGTTPLATITSSSYDDTGLSDETTYYYRLQAEDTGGNLSAYTTTNGTTTEDMRIPANPRMVQVRPANKILQIVWLPSISDFVDYYEAEVVMVDAVGTEISLPFTETATGTEIVISNLANNKRYRITLRSVSVRGFKSEGIVSVTIPTSVPGPVEVSNVEVSDTFDGNFIHLNVSWEPPSDSVGDPAVKYAITITSDTSSYSTITTTQTSIDIFALETLLGTAHIESLRNYIISIQAIDAQKRASLGIVKSITTRKFTPPASPTGAFVTLYQNINILFEWVNSTDDFDHNIISIISTTIDPNPTMTTIVDNLNVGKATSYIFLETLENNTAYTFEVSAVDSTGNISDTVSVPYEINAFADRPAAPVSVSSLSTPGFITLTWPQSESPYVSGYKIWRAIFSGRTTGADFTLLDTLTADDVSFIDYTVTGGVTYSYCITTVDIFGNETEGPLEGLVSPAFVSRFAVTNDTINDPSGLATSQSGDSVVLTWNSDTDFFDGYRIYRSIGNINSWEEIGNVDPSVHTFTDKNSLINGNRSYYYAIDKFRNEAGLLISVSSIIPVGSILIGKVTTSDDGVNIDQTGVIEIKDIRTPIIKETQKRIKAHRHFDYGNGDDRRINLSSSLSVNGWTTDNLNVYTTTETLPSVYSLYSVFVNGVETGILHTLDISKSQISFASNLKTTDVVTVIFEGVEETQGLLPRSRIAQIYANSISLGKINKKFIPPIDHEGSGIKVCLPAMTTISSAEGLHYAYKSVPVFTPTFYDILQIGSSGDMIAASSEGIITSDDYGNTWNKSFITTYPVTKLHYSSINEKYYCLGFHSVFISDGAFTKWTILEGMDGVNVVRDVVEDAGGIVYVSTDLGVFRLDPDSVEQRWEQSPTFSHKTTEVFAIRIQNGFLYASTEIGNFVSSDNAQTWNLSSEFQTQTPIYAFAFDGDTVFALTQDRVWRKKSDDSIFHQITLLDASSSRNMIVWRSKLYVTTDKGCFTSVNDISEDVVEFENILSSLSRGGANYDITCIKPIGTRLFLGTDQHLYSSQSHGIVVAHYVGGQFVSPTLYVNDKRQSLGYFYNKSYVSFDHRLKYNDEVLIATTYSSYTFIDGGWDGSLGTAKVYINNVLKTLSTTKITPLTGVFDLSEFRLDRYDQVFANISGITIKNIGTMSHRELEDAVEFANSGLSAGMSLPYHANVQKVGLYIEGKYRHQRDVKSPLYQTNIHLPCDDNWYDKISSTLEYKIASESIAQNLSLSYVATALHLPDYGQVWVGGDGGIVSIDTTTFDIVSVFSSAFVKQLVKINNSVYAITNDMIYVINPSTTESKIYLGTGLPSFLTSMVYSNNNFIVGASDGVYVKQSNRQEYQKTLSAVNVSVNDFVDTIMAVDGSGNVWNSNGGLSWNSKGNIGPVNCVTKIKSHMFVGKSDGLYEDNGTFYSKHVKVRRSNIANTKAVNSLCSIANTVSVGFSDGSNYTYSGGIFTNGVKYLETIHKILVVNGNLWLFGFDLLSVAALGKTVKVATGNRVTWQT